MLDEEADQLARTAPYERTDERAAYRAGDRAGKVGISVSYQDGFEGERPSP